MNAQTDIADDTLNFKCPHCENVVGVLQHLLGETIDCPVCEKPFRAEAPLAHSVHDSDVVAGDEIPTVATPAADEHVDTVIHPVVLRRHFFATLLCMLLFVAAVIGLVMGLTRDDWMGVPALPLLIGSGVLTVVAGFFLLKWYIASRMQSLTLTSERLIYRFGIIHRGTSEVRYNDVRNMKINQNLLERLLGFGDMAISSSGQDEMEIVIQDVPNPQAVAEDIRLRQR